LKRVIILADAAADIEAARDFYEGQEQGVGEYCVDSLLADIESLGLFSGWRRRHAATAEFRELIDLCRVTY
jgi:hypothetical protein